MKVLAIGATGFIGQNVLPLLIDRGHEVAVLHRGETVQSPPEDVREIRGNRDRLTDCRAELERFAPDVILDLILYTEQQTQQIVDIFRGTGGRVVAVSSGDVYRNYDGFRGKATAPPDPVPLLENAPLRETRYPYRGHEMNFGYAQDYEKILVEQLLLGEPALPATVLRLPAVYGPGDRQHRLRPYLQRMTDRQAQILLEEGQASWRWTRGFVENVAAAVALAVMDPRGVGHVYNVGDEPTFTEREWVERIARVAGWGGDVVAVPRSELPDDLRQPVDWRFHLWTDTAALRFDLEYVSPVPLDEALRRTVEWERSGLGE
ncbi:dTDP-glucose 4,6-dehydratase [Halomicronema hongdechloris C2206]|uniref:dTDP-glucose 4,6-dehydratase n=1 Tax=Halomicronema hongdechloris C2206 TaxID=1641165 RepID=A0A1Z3HP00_9CYAN|nr:NAD-dependent epimerase/dehydratase family protein [Halomicronema hongdechloris]ASC72000.1 dTDP-glucose 4,6-dehydratase [Halomicronema hongdechloris C2206]